MSKPDQTKGEKKSPTGNDGNLTAQHFAIGDKITTKSGKTGTVTHIHKKAGYLSIHNAEQGKTYHVSWASVTKVNGKDAADIAGKAEAEGGESMPGVGNYAGWLALKSHGWKPVNSTGGKVTFAHPEVGGTFHVDEAGAMTNDTSGTKIKAADATEYLRGSTPTRKVQAAAQAKKEVQAPAAPPSGTTTSTATSRTATREGRARWQGVSRAATA